MVDSAATLAGAAGVSTGSRKITEPGPGRYHVSAKYGPQGSFAAVAPASAGD
jgi:hypothetical protein